MNNNRISGNINFTGNENKNTGNNNSFNKINTTNNTTINNYFNPANYYKEDVHKYDNVDRLGIYDKVGDIITCEAIFLYQERITKSKEKFYIIANVLENGKLIADHLHVKLEDSFITGESYRIQLTGIVGSYGQGNNKRNIELINQPIWLNDKLRTNITPEHYSRLSVDKVNFKLSQVSKEDKINLIRFYKTKINNLTESSLGKDTIFNFALSQLSLNVNNNAIYNDNLEVFHDSILLFMLILLSAVIYDITTIMDNESKVVIIGDERRYAEISIYEIFRSICLYCNYLQGLTGIGNKHANESQGFRFICDSLKIKYNLAYAHTVKHRYTNFELGDEEVNIFEASRPLDVLGYYLNVN